MNPADYDACTTPRAGAGSATPNTRWLRAYYAAGGRQPARRRCGTGWFTRRAAADDLVATGLDPNPAWLDYAVRTAARP